MKRYDLLEHFVDDISYQEINEFVHKAILENQKKTIGNVNANAFYIANSNKIFSSFLHKNDIVMCDSKWVQFSIKFIYGKWINHLSYYNFIPSIFEFCSKKKHKIFLLGAEEKIVKKAASKLKARFPEIILEFHHGYFKKFGDENKKIINLINDSGSKILIVGFGMPIQEEWITNNIDDLNVNIICNGGGFLKIFSGVKVPPEWITTIGMEWFFRFIQQPIKLGRRYLFGNTFFKKSFFEKIRRMFDAN